MIDSLVTTLNTLALLRILVNGLKKIASFIVPFMYSETSDNRPLRANTPTAPTYIKE